MWTISATVLPTSAIRLSVHPGMSPRQVEERGISCDSWKQGPRTPEGLETSCEVAWPALSPGLRRSRLLVPPPLRNPDDSSSLDERTTTRSVDRSSSTDGICFDDEWCFPKLGQRLSKRKLQSAQSSASQEPLGSGSFEMIPGDTCNGEERPVANGSKKPRKTDMICIDIKCALERQRSLSESQTVSSAMASFQMNLNLSLRNPLDSSQVVASRRGKQIDGPHSKKVSKLKQAIFQERENNRQTNLRRRDSFELLRANVITKDVNEMRFDRLSLSPDAGEPEMTSVKSLSALTLFENGHQRPAPLMQPLDLPELRDADVKKFEGLMIRKEMEDEPQEVQTTPQKGYSSVFDPVIVAKTLCLKICDETGETVEDTAESDAICRNEKLDANSIPESNRHSKKFREYCTNSLTPGLNTATEIFLAEIYRLQRRMYQKNVVKGRCRRRFFAGLKEVLKHVESKKIRFVVIAPDLERVPDDPEGLDECVKKLIAACKGREIVFCFALNKRKLGYLTHKKGSVSCVGVTNYSGLEERFKDVLAEVILARNSYGRGENSLGDQGESQDFEDALLSTRINLLFRALAIAN